MKPIILTIALMLFAINVFGAGKEKNEVFWDTLHGKVQKLTSNKKTPSLASVAGVKGAKNGRSDIYWMGKENKNEMESDELEKFSSALKYQRSGEKNVALKHFEAFLQEFPNSPLHAEGKQAVQLLKGELSQQQPEADHHQ